MHGQKPREIAARVLRRREDRLDFVEQLLAEELKDSGLTPADRSLVQELVFGVVRWQATLDWLIARRTSGRSQKPGLRVLLRLGLYQLFWLDRIPDHAAVNETVAMARRSGLAGQSGFVNALLRACTRERDAIRADLARLKVEDVPTGYSHPAWLVARWTARRGPEATLRLLEWNNTAPRVFARLNTLRADTAALLARWKTEGVEFEPDAPRWDWCGEGLVFELRSHPSLASLGSFQDGWFYVQDPSTLLSVAVLDPQPGERILDACAAPGGKTTLIAQRMRNEGSVVARDTAPERLELVRENCTRLGVTCVTCTTTAVTPGTTPAGGLFDRVLVDAPCSNTGVLRRRLDLRWRVQPSELERLRKEQLILLSAAAEAVRPGGALVYSTCSLEPEENTGVVSSFLRDHASFTLELERELSPDSDGCDGGFVARLRRSAAPEGGAAG